jgi:hypothetical protein
MTSLSLPKKKEFPTQKKILKQLEKKLENFNCMAGDNAKEFIHRFMENNERIEIRECSIDDYIDECLITICCAENFSTGYSLMERRAYTRLCNAVIKLKDSFYKVIAFAVISDELREKLFKIESIIQKYIERFQSQPHLFVPEYV